MGERPLKAMVRVENFENRVRQGYGVDSPAMAYAGSAGMTAGCATWTSNSRTLSASW